MQPTTPVLKSQLVHGLAETVIAENQPPYKRLPAVVSGLATGRITTRWELTWRERWKLLWRGELYIQVLTYGEPLLPLKPFVDEPTVRECL